MNTMSSSSQYNDLSDFLAKHNAASQKNGTTSDAKKSTHTRIGNPKLNIYGGESTLFSLVLSNCLLLILN